MGLTGTLLLSVSCRVVDRFVPLFDNVLIKSVLLWCATRERNVRSAQRSLSLELRIVKL